MPDTRALFGDWLREHAADRGEPHEGWDTVATVVEGRWLDRVPRFPDAEAQLRNEIRLMPRLAPLLPLEVPVPVVLEESPLRGAAPLLVRRARDRSGPHARRRAAGWASSSARCTTCRSTSTSSPASPSRTAARAELLATLERMLHRVAAPAPDRAPGSRPGAAAADRAAHADHPGPRRPRPPTT